MDNWEKRFHDLDKYLRLVLLERDYLMNENAQLRDVLLPIADERSCMKRRYMVRDLLGGIQNNEENYKPTTRNKGSTTRNKGSTTRNKGSTIDRSIDQSAEMVNRKDVQKDDGTQCEHATYRVLCPICLPMKAADQACIDCGYSAGYSTNDYPGIGQVIECPKCGAEKRSTQELTEDK